MKHKDSKKNYDNPLLNNLLFDNKTIDLKNGINNYLIEEISNSILNNNSK